MFKLNTAMVLVMGVFLAGCSYEPDELEMAQARYVCREHGGLFKITSDTLNILGIVYCNDGKRYDPDEHKDVIIDDAHYYAKGRGIPDE